MTYHMVRQGVTALLLLSTVAVAAGAACGQDAASPLLHAMQDVEAQAEKAASDPHRPVYHFRPLAGHMNDINGPIWHQGWYHVFYQFKPRWQGKHWGHARSRDLVHWEQLPIALWPSEDQNEIACYSGTSVINGRGEPMLFYTSISRGYFDRPRPQDWHLKTWAALGDPDLLTWRKHPANTLISRRTQGEAGDGYDPFVFQHAGRTFLVLTSGSQLKLLEADDAELTRWTPRGSLFARPAGRTGVWECPNVVRLGEKWLVLVSVSPRHIEYFVGTFDVASYRFRAETDGILDHGHDEAGRLCVYGSNLLADARGRAILLAWVHGPSGPAWSGCMTLPRAVSLDPAGALRQQPVEELTSLRGPHHALAGFPLHNTARLLEGVAGDLLEIKVTLAPGDAGSVGLRVRHSADGKRAATIACDRKSLDVMGVQVPYRLAPGGELSLHVFLDKQVVEVYVDEGRACVTRVIRADAEDRGVELFAADGRAHVKALDVWELKP